MSMLNNFSNYSLLCLDEKMGLPCIKGTHVVTGVMLRVAVDYLLEQYPKLNKQQVLQALAYATIYERDVIK